MSTMNQLPALTAELVKCRSCDPCLCDKVSMKLTMCFDLNTQLSIPFRMRRLHYTTLAYLG